MLTLWVALASGPAFGSGEAEEAEIAFFARPCGLRGWRITGPRSPGSSRRTGSRRTPPSRSTSRRCYARTERYAEAYRWYTVAAEGLTDARSTPGPGGAPGDHAPGRGVRPHVRAAGRAGLRRPQGARRDWHHPFSRGGAVLARPGPSSSRSRAGRRPGSRGARRTGRDLPVTRRSSRSSAPWTSTRTEGTSGPPGRARRARSCARPPARRQLAPGNWVLYFHEDGFRDSVRQLEIVAEQTIRPWSSSRRTPARSLVNASERGALVEIDGEAVGFTPTVLQAVAVGNRTVRVSRPGYQPVERAIAVETDKQVTVDDIDLLPTDEVTAVCRRAERIELAPSSVTVICRRGAQGLPVPDDLRGAPRRPRVRAHLRLDVRKRHGPRARTGERLQQPSAGPADGATLNDNILNQGFISYDGRVDLIGVERIEVVRGPGSVLYGTGAVSGVVNLVGDCDRQPRGHRESASAPTTITSSAATPWPTTSSATATASGRLSRVRASQGRTEIVDPRGKRDDLPIEQFDKFTGVTTTGRLWLGDATASGTTRPESPTIPTGDYFTRLGDPTRRLDRHPDHRRRSATSPSCPKASRCCRGST